MSMLQTANKNRITIGDTIYATVMSCGHIVYTERFAGMSSVEEVYRYLRNTLSRNNAGPLTIILRNGTQGWTLRSNIMRRTVTPEATQLTLW